jgi:hypothetical protein
MVYSLKGKHYSAYGVPMSFKIPKSWLRSGIYVQISIEWKRFIDAPIVRMRVRTNDAHAFKSSLFGFSPARLSH